RGRDQRDHGRRCFPDRQWRRGAGRVVPLGLSPKQSLTRRAHSIRILFLTMTSRQRAVSAAIKVAVSAGVVPPGSAPSERYFVRTSGWFGTSATSAASSCSSAG